VTRRQAKLLQELAAHTACNCGDNECFGPGDRQEILKAVAELPEVIEKAWKYDELCK